MKYLFAFILIICLEQILSKTNVKSNLVENISDVKDLKKLLRTKTNVLILYTANVKETQNAVKIFKETSDIIKGQGTMVLIDCSNVDAKKLCKKMKISPAPISIKHYKEGEFHKDYDRQLTVNSIVNFMRDPTGDLPWDEDPTGSDVVHLTDTMVLVKFLKKETKPIMIMFYAPWCGYCKKLKPDYSAAATELKPKYILAAIDVNRPENSAIRKLYNITGFPTLLYFESGQLQQVFEGDNTKDGIIAFMKDPKAAPPPKEKEIDWASESTSEIVHLTSTNFESVLIDEKSVMVMFYAPWCGHCKRMKPEYEKAAILMREKQIPGILAALDATKEEEIAAKYNVKGYPTVKYFANGEFKFDVNVRDADKIVEFMKNPSEPPPPPPAEVPWDEEESNVVHLNDEIFKTFLKKKKHVLVMFYAPWCGHCKKAKPEFKKAAEHFKDDPKVELAAVDCTRFNSICTVYNVKGYPTIKYFSYLKEQRDYSGGRTEIDFIKYLTDPDAPEEIKAPEPFGVYPGSENIQILTDKTFDEKLRNEPKSLVMFYAPWCGHCTQMKPAFSEMAKRVTENKLGVVAAVDATIQQKLSEKYSIQGFPTIKYFENGIYKSDYNGKRTADDLYNFIQGGGVAKDEL